MEDPDQTVDASPRPEPAVRPTAPESPPEPESPVLEDIGDEDRVGQFRIERELARGGMGVVYLAHDTELDRPVALKRMLPNPDAGPEQRERFLREARAAARLQHNNIVAIHQVGDVDGDPYFVMDLIEGTSLADHLRPGPLDGPQAARIAAAVARALDYAHGLGVLHRDVKPRNVLLRGDEPLLTDFGLAKRIDTRETGLTRSGQLLGTASYMPPEQAAGEAGRVDRRADVYALGATLYEMVAGRPPFVGTLAQVLTAVLSYEAPRPSRWARVDPDLETICLKCLQKDPAERYGTAKELAEDLDRYIAGEPIRARPPTLAIKVRKFVARNTALVSVIVGFLILSAIGLAAAQAQLAIEAEKTKSAEKEKEAQEARAEAEALKAQGAEAERKAAAERAETAEAGERQREVQALREAGMRAWNEQRWGDAGVLLAAANEKAPDAKLHARVLTALSRQPAIVDLPLRRGWISYGVSWSPDGEFLFATAPKQLRFHGRDGKLLHTVSLKDHARGLLAWGPNGIVALGSGSREVLSVYDVSGGKVVDTLRFPRRVEPGSASFAPDGRLAIAAGSSVRIWTRGAAARELDHGEAVSHVAWSSDGKWLATGAKSGKVRVWSEDTLEPVPIAERKLQMHQAVFALAWSRDGSPARLACSYWGGHPYLGLWREEHGRFVDAVRPELRDRLKGSYGWLRGIAWVPGKPSWLMIEGRQQRGGVQHHTDVWDLNQRRSLSRWPVELRQLSPAPGGERFALLKDEQVYIIAGRGFKDVVALTIRSQSQVAWDPRGRYLAVAGSGSPGFANHARLLDMHGSVRRELRGGGAAIAWAPNARLLAMAGTETAQVWDTRTGAVTVLEQGRHNVRWDRDDPQLVWSPDSKRVAIRSKRYLSVWGGDGRRRLFGEMRIASGYGPPAWSPQNTLAVVVTLNQGGLTLYRLRLLDRDGNRLAEQAGSPAATLAWSPNGARLAVSNAQGVVVRDGRTLETIRELKLGARATRCVWSADGAWLAVVADTGSGRLPAQVSLFDTKTWTAGFGRWAGGEVVFSADGKRVAVTDGMQVSAYATRARRHLGTLKGDFRYLRSMAWRDANKTLVVHCYAGVFVWTPGQNKAVEARSPMRAHYAALPSGGLLIARFVRHPQAARQQTLNRTIPDGTVELLDASGRMHGALTCPDGTAAPLFSPDARQLALRTGDRIEVWDVPTVILAPAKLRAVAEQRAGETLAQISKRVGLGD